MIRYLILSLLLVAGSFTVSAQDELPTNPPPTQVTTPAPAQVPATADDGLPVNRPVFNENAAPTRTNVEIWLSTGVLVFGAIVALAMLFLLSKRTEGGNASDFTDSLRYPIVFVIIVAVLFLVTAGYDSTQMAPMLGLLGTIAGYLMGRGKSGS